MSETGEENGTERLWESREARWSAASGLLLVIGFLLSLAGASDLLTAGIYVTATIVGVDFFALEGLEMLVKDRVIGIELLMSIAALIAGLLGLWGEVASLAFLYSISSPRPRRSGVGERCGCGVSRVVTPQVLSQAGC